MWYDYSHSNILIFNSDAISVTSVYDDKNWPDTGGIDNFSILNDKAS